MERIKLIRLSLLLILCGTLLFTTLTFLGSSVSAISNNEVSIENISQDMFGDVKIQSAEYLHNYDGSPDYIYVDYQNCGYAVYLKETGALLEYAPQGNLPYLNSSEKKYYGGPGDYFIKSGEEFINIETNESFTISASDAKSYSSQIRNTFNDTNASKKIQNIHQDIYFEEQNAGFETIAYNAPMTGGSSYNPNNPPNANPFGTAETTYISNYQYFLNINWQDSYGYNDENTCGAVAAQILLNYHNYYTDRRIIPDRYLNGYDDTTNTVTNSERNPNYCEDPLKMDYYTLGSRSSGTGANDYYAYMLSYMSGSNSAGQVARSLRDILKARNQEIGGGINYGADHDFGLFGINPDDVKAEINADRPVILLMQKFLGGIDHFVVAYGYQNMNGDFGFIVNYGHEADKNNKWINTLWNFAYIKLQISHTHSYTDTGKNINGTHRELRCGECGHRTSVSLFNYKDLGNNKIEITGAKYSLAGNITIPSEIDGKTVVSIGNSAFANCTNITGISLGGDNLINIPDILNGSSTVNSIERATNIRLKAGVTYTLSFDYKNLHVPLLGDPETSIGVGETAFETKLANNSFSKTGSQFNEDGRQVIEFTPTSSQLSSSNKLWVRSASTRRGE